MIYKVMYHSGGWGGAVELFTFRSKKGAKKFRKKCSRTLEREFGREVKDAIIPKIYVQSHTEPGDPGHVEVVRPTPTTLPIPNVGERLREAARNLRFTQGAQWVTDEQAANQAREGTWGGIVRTADVGWQARAPQTGAGTITGRTFTPTQIVTTDQTLRGTDWITRFYE